MIATVYQTYIVVYVFFLCDRVACVLLLAEQVQRLMEQLMQSFTHQGCTPAHLRSARPCLFIRGGRFLYLLCLLANGRRLVVVKGPRREILIKTRPKLIQSVLPLSSKLTGNPLTYTRTLYFQTTTLLLSLQLLLLYIVIDYTADTVQSQVSQNRPLRAKTLSKYFYLNMGYHEGLDHWVSLFTN